jgi:hypothetical protein
MNTTPPETWLPQRPQRQDSLVDQLTDLHRVAARLGMYDAADWLWKHVPWDHDRPETPARES